MFRKYTLNTFSLTLLCIGFAVISAYLAYIRLYQPTLTNNLASKSTYSISSTELAYLLKTANSNILLFDLRSYADYSKGHIPAAKQYEIDEPIKIRDLDKKKIIVIYSQTSDLSMKLAKQLRESGYQSFYLEGGWAKGWQPYLEEACSTCGKTNLKNRVSSTLKFIKERMLNEEGAI